MKKIAVMISSLLSTLPVYAAIPVNLSLKPIPFFTRQPAFDFQEKNRSVDFKQTLHIRVKQTYQGYPVWNGDAVIHIPNKGQSTEKAMLAITKQSFMNGIFYKDIKQDLQQTNPAIFTEKQKQVAIRQVTLQAESKVTHVKNPQAQLMVFIDDKNTAHWTYKINYYISGTAKRLPQKLNYLVDAESFKIYAHWDDVKTLEDVKAGGFAGNHKTGKKILDGLPGNLPSLDIKRNAKKKICYMQNANLSLLDVRSDKTMSFECVIHDHDHNHVYWNGSYDKIATTWSPSNDVMFGLEVTRKMYLDWYKMPMIINSDGTPKFLTVWVHDAIENAYWDGEKAVFGDSIGSDKFNPFTQLDTVTHEISHGFTEQHSDLIYSNQSGGMNEAFSDIAGMAAEYYIYGSTKFLIGVGDVIAEGKALRYMDQPSKDCEAGSLPGEHCSIDSADQFTSRLDPHYSSGVYNRFYYNLANTKDWDAKKAFDILVQANAFYWTSTSTYKEGACGVMQAARDYHYDLKAVTQAFKVVGIDTSGCRLF